MSLKAMSVSKLKDLKSQVEAAIRTKVTERRHEIESELSKLSRLDGSGRAKVVRAQAKGMVARKVGKKLDEPLTANSPVASTPKKSKKIKKARKMRKAANSVAAGLSTLPTAEHIEALPVEALPVASMHANDMPTDVSAAAQLKLDHWVGRSLRIHFSYTAD
jgi:hypothetical protein